MQVEFIEPASIELDDAIEYYDLQVKGLGQRFLDEVLETIEIIKAFPSSWIQNTINTRKASLRKFPYNLIYSILNNKIYIIAIAHQNRLPEYWIDRIKE
ncbi:MAG: type II toxin-antitoxin system RelE/ParE family toxin [Ignavibacteriales bacterium]|nr:type II toxin-antitoxin system RelE/ParE family toxin [Ignavibacteriales bacterium]